MPRQNTRIESEGAEFLVLGQLLIAGIPANKSYRNTPGYDRIATSPEQNSSARISVKSRWRTKAEGFIIRSFDCDLVVIAKLNRGSRDGHSEVLPPEFAGRGDAHRSSVGGLGENPLQQDPCARAVPGIVGSSSVIS